MQNTKILFFDGLCNFCNMSVNFVWKNNKSRNIYYSSLQSDFAKIKLSSIGIDKISLRTIYFYDGYRVYQKSRAVLMILRNFDGVFYPFIAKILLIVPKFISDHIYDIISKNRYDIMGKSASCRVPTLEEEDFYKNLP